MESRSAQVPQALWPGHCPVTASPAAVGAMKARSAAWLAAGAGECRAPGALGNTRGRWLPECACCCACGGACALGPVPSPSRGQASGSGPGPGGWSGRQASAAPGPGRHTGRARRPLPSCSGAGPHGPAWPGPWVSGLPAAAAAVAGRAAQIPECREPAGFSAAAGRAGDEAQAVPAAQKGHPQGHPGFLAQSRILPAGQLRLAVWLGPAGWGLGLAGAGGCARPALLAEEGRGGGLCVTQRV